MKLHGKDLFGNKVEQSPLLRDKFIEPPFSVLDTKSGSWRDRKQMWLNLGIDGELEVYSDLPGELSNMVYSDFITAYRDIIKKACVLLKPGCLACFVVSEFRNKKGEYVGFVPDTVASFRAAGMAFYNDAVLLNMLGSASMRAGGNMRNKKLVRVHQNVLVFKKPC